MKQPDVLMALRAVHAAAGEQIEALCDRYTAKVDRDGWTFFERGVPDHVIAEVRHDGDVLVHTSATDALPALRFATIEAMVLRCHCGHRHHVDPHTKPGTRVRCPHCDTEVPVRHK